MIPETWFQSPVGHAGVREVVKRCGIQILEDLITAMLMSHLDAPICTGSEN